MSARHILTRGRLVGVRSLDDGICAPAVTSALLTIATDGDEHDLTVTPDVAAAIAADQLLFADVEVCLSRAGETTPADGERARYLAASADVARLERALADAERTVRVLRAGHDAADTLRAAIGHEVAHARFVAAASDSDAIRGAMGHVAERLRGLLDPQRPHGPAADVERVVVGEGTVTTAFGRGRVWTPDPSAGGGHYRMLSGEAVALYAHNGRRARVVVELLPAAGVDAQQGVGDETGESAGAVGGGDHDANLTATTGAEKSGAQ